MIPLEVAIFGLVCVGIAAFDLGMRIGLNIGGHK